MADSVPDGWRQVLGVHEATAAQFVTLLRRLPLERWQQPQPGRKWSPADEAIHIALSYEMALATMTQGATMQPRVSAARARLLRWLVLPVILRTNWFPRASAPAEVRPPEAEARAATVDSTAGRIERAAAGITKAAARVEPGARFQHAYFGPLPPQVVVRLLAAHTRHHHRTLARRL